MKEAGFAVGQRVYLDPAQFPYASEDSRPLIVTSVTMVEHVMIKMEGGDEECPYLARELLAMESDDPS